MYLQLYLLEPYLSIISLGINNIICNFDLFGTKSIGVNCPTNKENQYKFGFLCYYLAIIKKYTYTYVLNLLNTRFTSRVPCPVTNAHLANTVMDTPHKRVLMEYLLNNQSTEYNMAEQDRFICYLCKYVVKFQSTPAGDKRILL